MSKTSQTTAPVGKTIREWLEELPEPYRSQALANAAMAFSLDETSCYLEDALRDSFFWYKTPEGADYWSDLHTNITDPHSLARTDLHSLVRTYLTVKDELTDAIMSRDDDTRRIGEDMDKAEKALREAVGL